MHVANEGRFVVFVAPSRADDTLNLLRGDPLAAGAERIGTVAEGTPGRVILRSAVGTHRLLDMLSGEQLPRIC
jgi:hydrogenase expression/formation protein HypE